MTKEQILEKLWDLWIHVGAARDNEEKVDYDFVQGELLLCKEAIEKL